MPSAIPDWAQWIGFAVSILASIALIGASYVAWRTLRQTRVDSLPEIEATAYYKLGTPRKNEFDYTLKNLQGKPTWLVTGLSMRATGKWPIGRWRQSQAINPPAPGGKITLTDDAPSEIRVKFRLIRGSQHNIRQTTEVFVKLRRTPPRTAGEEPHPIREHEGRRMGAPPVVRLPRVPPSSPPKMS